MAGVNPEFTAHDVDLIVCLAHAAADNGALPPQWSDCLEMPPTEPLLALPQFSHPPQLSDDSSHDCIFPTVRSTAMLHDGDETTVNPECSTGHVVAVHMVMNAGMKGFDVVSSPMDSDICTAMVSYSARQLEMSFPSANPCTTGLEVVPRSSFSPSRRSIRPLGLRSNAASLCTFDTTGISRGHQSCQRLRHSGPTVSFQTDSFLTSESSTLSHQGQGGMLSAYCISSAYSLQEQQHHINTQRPNTKQAGCQQHQLQAHFQVEEVQENFENRNLEFAVAVKYQEQIPQPLQHHNSSFASPLYNAQSKEMSQDKDFMFDRQLRDRSLAIFSATDEQMQRPMKKARKYAKATPSRFCHICTRQSKKASPLVFCHNIARGTCRKAVCEKCFVKFGWDWDAASTPDSEPWLCPHCCNICPNGAQCFNYVSYHECSQGRKLILTRLTRDSIVWAAQEKSSNEQRVDSKRRKPSSQQLQQSTKNDKLVTLR
jgi:hypothetical protein